MADDTPSRATHIADAMPLVHFPASARFADWSKWGALTSNSERDCPRAPGPFGRLRDEHVFVYAGPCCYYHDDCIGDAVLYFASGAEHGRAGSATPFDSGALEDELPRLQPFCHNQASERERWEFFEQQQVPLVGWRARFAAWLAHCYEDPDRYMDSNPDRYAAGEPDRTIPPVLLDHNGTRGREMYGAGGCGDRRAWTWEVRIEARLPFEDLALLHVPFDAIECVGTIVSEIEEQRRPQIRAISRDVAISADVLYEASGAILRELVGP